MLLKLHLQDLSMDVWVVLTLVAMVLLVSGCIQQDKTLYEMCDSCCPEDNTPYDDCDSCCSECPELGELALMDVAMDSWAMNLYNSSEFIFSIISYNYGFIEAKNVEITCEVSRTGLGQIYSVASNIGNIASTSYKYTEIIVDSMGLYIEEGSNEYFAYCYVSSCDECEILYERIPQLI